MNAIIECKKFAMNDIDELNQYWEDLDRHWHLPPLAVNNPSEDLCTEDARRRRRIRRAQRAAASGLSCAIAH